MNDRPWEMDHPGMAWMVAASALCPLRLGTGELIEVLLRKDDPRPEVRRFGNPCPACSKNPGSRYLLKDRAPLGLAANFHKVQ